MDPTRGRSLMTSPPALRRTVDSRGCIPPALFPSGPERQWRIFRGRAPELARLRRWLVRLLPDTPTRDDRVTIAVQLATNAIQHTPRGQGGAFTVQIRRLAGPPPDLAPGADPAQAAPPHTPPPPPRS